MGERQLLTVTEAQAERCVRIILALASERGHMIVVGGEAVKEINEIASEIEEAQIPLYRRQRVG